MNLARVAAAAFGLALMSSSAIAQDTPPIKIIVGFSAGGVTDVLARVFAEDLRKRLNTTVIVENKPGGSGTIATVMVSKLPPDGTTLIMIPGTHTMVPSIQKVDFDTKTALTYISLIATAPSMLTVNKGTKYTDVKSVVEDAKARPGEIAYGSSGVGSTSHFMGILFEREAKVKLNHIPFKSSGESLQAVMGGHVPMSFSAVNQALGAVKSGDVRALAIGSEKRSIYLPDVPTFAEVGLPKVLSETWIGLAGPANMAPDLVKKINDAVMAGLQSPDVQKRLSEIGVDEIAAGPGKFTKIVASEVDTYETLARDMNLPR
ncbi:MAG: tripartite tricarboxylate transporter substrate binding protein [Afipia sp.]|nr:tripartite tricarboxylate transporter substrate binding protein [Afipia sp.]